MELLLIIVLIGILNCIAITTECLSCRSIRTDIPFAKGPKYAYNQLFCMHHFLGSSPMVLEKLDSGWHSIKVIAVGNSCAERQPLKVNFVV